MNDSKQAIVSNNEPKELSERHKRVIELIADGMPKGKAYQKVYPDCKTVTSACNQVVRVFKNPNAKAYLTELQDERTNYIESQNRLNNNNISELYINNFNLIKTTMSKALIEDDLTTVNNLINTMFKGLNDYSRTFGNGTFDPTLKLKIMMQTNDLNRSIKKSQLQDPHLDKRTIEQSKSLLQEAMEQLQIEEVD